MGMKTTYVVQPFARVRGQLTPARAEAAQTDYGAMKRAEALAGRMPGAAAIKVVADDETGERESVTVLGQWGDVPEDFADSLRS